MSLLSKSFANVRAFLLPSWCDETAMRASWTWFFATGPSLRLVLDQGFGCWHLPLKAQLRYDFSASVGVQVDRMMNCNVALEGGEPSYLVITRG